MVLLQIFYFVLVLDQIHTVLSVEGEADHDAKRPNIVFILAEDLGWDDIAIHGSRQIVTPTMDDLSRSGVLLNSYYTSPSPFATRCEIMTGKYATKLGVQHGVFHNKQKYGLPENEKILPEYLQELGYSTHAVGKWGLGFYKEEMLPWKRGFDTFYGGLSSSSVDYFTHSGYDENYGLDLRNNEEIVHNETGKYATELYTEQAVKIINEYEGDKPFFLYVSHQAVHSGNLDDPLQVPDRYLEKLKHVKDMKRRKFAGMVNALDESILNISIALSDRGFMSNTVVIFTSLSGGAVGGMELSSGSNYPLRGSKMTVWEGGIRTVAFVVSDSIADTSFVNEELFHSTDWLPTIISLATAGEELPIPINGLDGYNVWQSMINKKSISPRFEILHQFDSIQNNLCALRVGDYKIIVNQDIGYYGDWFPRPAEIDELQNRSESTNTMPNAKLRCDRNYPHPFLEMHAPPCDPTKKPCLFNIQWDPCEFHNLASFMPNTLKVLRDRLNFYHKIVATPIYPEMDPKADPENNDGVWGPWVGIKNKTSVSSSNFTEEEEKQLAENDINGGQQQQQPLYPLQSDRFQGAIVPASQNNSVNSGNESTITTAPFIMQLNQTIASPTEKYQNISTAGPDVVNTTQITMLEINNSSAASTSNTSDNANPSTNAGNTLSGTISGDSQELKKTTSGEYGGETNTSETYGSISETMTAKTNSLAAKVSDQNGNVLGLSHDGLKSESNNSNQAFSAGKDGDWMKALDVNTSNTKNQNSFTINGQFNLGQSNETVPETTNQTIAQNASDHSPGIGLDGYDSFNGGPGQTNLPPNPTTSTLTTIPVPSTSKLEKPTQREMNKTEKENFVGTETGSETSSESEAGGAVMNKLDTNSTGIKDPYYNAQLNTIADAGSNGAKVMNSSATMTSGGKINPNKIPTASEFIPKPNYTSIEKPELTKPVNDIINPFEVKNPYLDSSLSAGAGTETGAGSESETKVGSLAETLTSLGKKQNQKTNKNNRKEGSSSASKTDKNVNNTPKSFGLGEENVHEPGLSSATASMYPQRSGPDFYNKDNKTTDLLKPLIIGTSDNGASTSTDAGSESYSQVGAFGGGGSSTNTTGNATTPLTTSYLDKNAKDKLSNFIKPMLHATGEKGSGITLVSPGEVNQRVFQSVSDVISDSSNQLCPDGRNCINKALPDTKVLQSNNTHEGETEATSNSANGYTNNLEAKSKDSKENNGFNGTVWFHHKKFAIVGTANEIDVKIQEDDHPVKNAKIPESPLPPQAPTEQRKQNIGFNVMFPASIIKQLASPKLTDEAISKTPNNQKDTVERVSFVRHQKPKAAIKKVLDMITDPERTRKTEVPVPRVSDILTSAIREPDTVDMTVMNKEGDTGDIGAVKPISRDTVLEPPVQKISHNTTSEVEVTNENVNQQKSPANLGETSGDLGSIVTLVGKSKSDHESTKRMKQNETSNGAAVNSDESSAHKKTMQTSEHLASKHTQQNASSSSETNAANINQISGPSNSIIVSSVIVVLIASFVVVGMAVVAVVAVVARHCNLGKHLQNGS